MLENTKPSPSRHPGLVPGPSAKESPILFSTEMVKAILEGRKTQTRRVTGLDNINLYPDKCRLIGIHHRLGQRDLHVTFDLHKLNNQEFDRVTEKKLGTLKFPYGQIGDTLWVRETYWRHINTPKDHAGIVPYQNCHYATLSGNNDAEWLKTWYVKKPAIHMPKTACRIWLTITDIRIERVQNISYKDAMAEGVQMTQDYWKDYNNTKGDTWTSNPKSSFESLWRAINGNKSWVSNPWVWVIEFKRKPSPKTITGS